MSMATSGQSSVGSAWSVVRAPPSGKERFPAEGLRLLSCFVFMFASRFVSFASPLRNATGRAGGPGRETGEAVEAKCKASDTHERGAKPCGLLERRALDRRHENKARQQAEPLTPLVWPRPTPFRPEQLVHAQASSCS